MKVVRNFRAGNKVKCKCKNKYHSKIAFATFTTRGKSTGSQIHERVHQKLPKVKQRREKDGGPETSFKS